MNSIIKNNDFYHKYKNYTILTFIVYYFSCALLYAKPLLVTETPSSLTIKSEPTLLSSRNPRAGLSDTGELVTRNIMFTLQSVFDSNGNILSALTGDSSQNTQLALAPLFYPSPFRITEGSHLYLKFSDSDASGEIELRIYDMRANEIYRAQKMAMGHHLRFKFSADELGHANMPAGVYFFLVLHNGKVLTTASGAIAGKGKFAILP